MCVTVNCTLILSFVNYTLILLCWTNQINYKQLNFYGKKHDFIGLHVQIHFFYILIWFKSKVYKCQLIALLLRFKINPLWLCKYYTLTHGLFNQCIHTWGVNALVRIKEGSKFPAHTLSDIIVAFQEKHLLIATMSRLILCKKHLKVFEYIILKIYK